MLDQRSLENTSWSFFLAGDSAREHLSTTSQTKHFLESLSNSLLVSVCLSIHLPRSTIFSMTNSCKLVTGSMPGSKISLINTVLGHYNAIKYLTTHIPNSNFDFYLQFNFRSLYSSIFKLKRRSLCSCYTPFIHFISNIFHTVYLSTYIN